jgi:hypothetical protein
MFGIPCVILANGMSMLLITVRFSLIWTAVVFVSLVAVAIAYWRPPPRRIDLITTFVAGAATLYLFWEAYDVRSHSGYPSLAPPCFAWSCLACIPAYAAFHFSATHHGRPTQSWKFSLKSLLIAIAISAAFCGAIVCLFSQQFLGYLVVTVLAMAGVWATTAAKYYQIPPCAAAGLPLVEAALLILVATVGGGLLLTGILRLEPRAEEAKCPFLIVAWTVPFLAGALTGVAPFVAQAYAGHQQRPDVIRALKILLGSAIGLFVLIREMNLTAVIGLPLFGVLTGVFVTYRWVWVPREL